MRYEEARRLADTLVKSMQPYCERIAIAGSIRRHQSEVKDIEIVAIPKYGPYSEAMGMFDAADLPVEENANLLHKWSDDPATQGTIMWIKPATKEIVEWHVEPDGKYWRGYLPDYDIKLDIFLCTPENWGGIFLIRTGSKDFSRAVMTHAKTVGYHFDKGYLYRDGEVVPMPEENNVFEALDLQPILPHEREGEHSLKRLVCL